MTSKQEPKKNFFKQLAAGLNNFRRQHRIITNVICIVLVLTTVVAGSMMLLRCGTRHNARVEVPDFTDMNISDAKRLAENRKLEIVVNDTLFVQTSAGDAVLEQLPKGGTQVKPGRKIYVTINDSHQRSVEVPYVAERSLRQAKNMLESVGLEIRWLEYVDDIATNYVLEEYFNGRRITDGCGIKAEIGSGIELRVGLNEESSTAYIPRLVGLPLARAKSKLWETGFNVGKCTFDDDVDLKERADACVYYQSVSQGRTAKLGTVVDLRLTTNAEKRAKGESDSDAELKQILIERAALERQADSLRALGATLRTESDEETEEDYFF